MGFASDWLPGLRGFDFPPAFKFKCGEMTMFFFDDPTDRRERRGETEA